jgi:uncharacterized damage-inducible protein DinB
VTARARPGMMPDMTRDQQPLSVLRHYLDEARETVLWKVDGVGEYDARRPLTPTGTNLLGVVKHLASVELGYMTLPFGRPLPVALPWHADDADPNDDLWLTVEETRDDVVALYRLAGEVTARTCAELDADAPGSVPWWPPARRDVTVHTLLVHLVAETARHAGQLDVLREGLDGAAGHRPASSNLPGEDYDWAAHRARVEDAARRAGTG